jgi:predicted DCC family thiol-disulfide oxidoreductase YuxK
MKEFDAYCRYCEMVVRGKTTGINQLESGNYLYIGECLICLYEIRRIVPKDKQNVKY